MNISKKGETDVPNIKSAKKRTLVTEKKTEQNKIVKTQVKNQIKKFREGIKVGDRVVTAGGIYGKVRSIEDTTFSLEISKDVRITIDKGSVYPSAQQASEDAAQGEKK